ncbi:DEAD-box ATP-dependent RNA helicase 32 [Platanthera guangdongensis]|uniref:ATP-dependent RNA helicase n=1 Tax=Platanthera guangdongensis TaxID=2320717 RepID=A0ABR2LXR8_9ASPA
MRKVKNSRKQLRLSESEEIQLLDHWIEAQKPDSGTNPLAIPPPPPDAPVGMKQDGGFTPFSGCKLFRQLPISRKTKEGLTPKYKEMSEIQRASLPHSLCGRDILGAAKTGSGKTLAFIIPVTPIVICDSSMLKALFDISGRREASQESGNGRLERSTGAPPSSVKTPGFHPFTPAVLARSSPNILSPARSGRNGAPPECQTEPKAAFVCSGQFVSAVAVVKGAVRMKLWEWSCENGAVQNEETIWQNSGDRAVQNGETVNECGFCSHEHFVTQHLQLSVVARIHHRRFLLYSSEFWARVRRRLGWRSSRLEDGDGGWERVRKFESKGDEKEKTLVVEKLYRARWGPEDGVGSIIISPTKELAGQLFEELKIIGKIHTLSAGLLIGGRKDVDAEKDSVSSLNILICTPGRLLQHMNETPNFECSQLQVLVLDEADRMLDKKFKGELDAIISQLPKRRQTLLFSATQTKSVKDLARLSLKDPEYISVHAESTTATPEQLKQVAMEVALDQKLNMLWSFIKSHLRSKMIVFLSTCKQVKFVYEAFRKLRPGIPLKCLHGNMKQNTRMAVYLDFCETISVLFSTDVASRGLDFPSVDWVIQVDCPEDVAAYIHRVGRTARFTSAGNSLLFLVPSEKAMLTKLHAAEPKIPIILRKVKVEKIEQISGALASVLVKYPDMQQLAIRAFITYVRSINHQKDKDIFDVSRLPLEEYSASLGLHITPKINSKSQKMMNRKELVNEQNIKNKVVDEDEDELLFSIKQRPNGNNSNAKAEEEDDILRPMNSFMERGPSELAVLPPIISKKKKLKIIVDRPARTRVEYDEDGNPIVASSFAIESPDTCLEPEKGGDTVMERYKKMVLEVKQRDKEDKLLQRQRLREKRTKKKNKLKSSRDDDECDDDGLSESEREKVGPKNKKICFESDEEEVERKMKKVKGLDADAISLAEQEALALKLLSSMH